jgi:uncharacterized membrane protein YtjA (UPF0391 family)
MLHYAIVFFVIAIIAAVFGFTGIAAGAAEIAKILFYIFLVVFVERRRRPSPQPAHQARFVRDAQFPLPDKGATQCLTSQPASPAIPS